MLVLGEGKRCFLHCNQSRTWTEAGEFCKGINGQLVIVDTEPGRKAVMDVKKSSGSGGAWVGGRSQPLYWHWIDGSGTYKKPLITTVMGGVCY